MADPRDDNMEQEMMDMINDGTEVEFDGADENPEVGFDDGSQYLNDMYEEEQNITQDNAGKVYIYNLLHIFADMYEGFKMISFFCISRFN
jgi:hypothetical protein